MISTLGLGLINSCVQMKMEQLRCGTFQNTNLCLRLMLEKMQEDQAVALQRMTTPLLLAGEMVSLGPTTLNQGE